MSWPFVGRSEQLDRIRALFTAPRPGPLMLVGPPGMGRSRLLAEALSGAPLSPDDIVVRLEPAGWAPFAALRGLLPAGFARAGSPDHHVAGAAAEVAARLTGRRPVIAFDDAHLADQHTMRVLRRLHRTHGALVLVTAPGTGALPHGPDPLDCLRYEPGARTLRLPPLSSDEVAMILTDVLGGPIRASTAEALHAASGGNPRLLHALMIRDGLAAVMVRHGGVHELPGPLPPADHRAREPLADHLIGAAGEAWRELALDRADELCWLVAWHGAAGPIAPVWAMVLLLRGQVDTARRVLDTYAIDGSPRVAMTRAILVGLGEHRPADALAMLENAAHLDRRHRERLLACHAWLLAVTGASSHGTDAVDPGADGEGALFYRAGQAVAALTAGRANAAVAHLRRALAAADCLRAELPWFHPYLTACLIDALLLAGRIGEATAEAATFHAGRRGCGWDVAVAFDSLLATRPPAAALRPAS